MAIEVFANSAASTLNGGINSSVTSLIVTSATGFPTIGNFRILIEAEIMLVTAVSGTTFTVTRGVEGTSPASHVDTTAVTHILTAGSFFSWLNDRGIVINSNYGDRKPASAGTYDEEFEGTIDTLPSNWAWASSPSGGDTWKLNSDYPSVLVLYASNGTPYRLRRTSFTPATTFGLWMKIAFTTNYNTDSGDIRLYIMNSGETEGRAIEFYTSSPGSINVRGLYTQSNSEGAWTSAYNVGQSGNTIYLGITRGASDSWKCWCSNNGIGWHLVGTATHSFTVDRFNLLFATPNGWAGKMGIDWLRYRADLNLPG